jgi:anti-anti-sigma regulatory factor
MLRITRAMGQPTTTVLKLEGQVRGQWVDELGRACTEALGEGRGRLTLDLEDVSFIDAAGLVLFRELASHDVAFHNCSLFAAEQLKAVSTNER